MVPPNKAYSTSECIVSACSHRFGDQLRHSWLGAFCWTTLIQTEVVLPFFVWQYHDQATVAMCHILLVTYLDQWTSWPCFEKRHHLLVCRTGRLMTGAESWTQKFSLAGKDDRIQ